MALERVDVASSVGVVSSLSELGELQAECAQLCDVVIELVDAALDAAILVCQPAGRSSVARGR